MGYLQDKAFNGLIWSSVHRFGVMAITFVSNIILARLLSPEDYGCIGMLMIFISLANTFIDGGFGSALIQKKEPTKEDYSTIFYWNVFLSFLLYVVIYFSAPYIAIFYRIPLLESVLRVQGVILILNAFSIVQQTILRKQLNFRKLAITNIVSALLSLVVAIILAYNGFGVWSLVAQQLSLGVFNALIFWITTKWIPLVKFSFHSFRELFRFGGFMLLSHLFSTFSNEIQGLLVGRAFNPSVMGLYTQAYKLEGAVATTTSSIIDQVTYPILSSIQDDKSKLISALKRFNQIPSFICAPLMMIMIVVAEPLITLLYSDRWIDCVPYFQILCTAGLAVCLQGAANNAIAAIGASKVLLRWTIVKRSITIILCVIGIQLGGMSGLLWGCVIGAWCVYFINAMLVAKHIGYSFRNQIKDICPYVLISIAIGCVLYILTKIININMYIEAVCIAIIGTAVYISIIKVLKLDILPFIVSTIRHKIKR